MSHITTVEISTQKLSKQRASEVTELQILRENEGLVCACPHSFWENVKKRCLAAEHVGLRSSLSTVYTLMNTGNEMLLMGEVFPSVNYK